MTNFGIYEPPDYPDGLMFQLAGSCGHRLQVCLSPDGSDARRVHAVVKTGCHEIHLERFCAFCMDARQFTLSVDDAATEEMARRFVELARGMWHRKQLHRKERFLRFALALLEQLGIADPELAEELDEMTRKRLKRHGH